MNQRLHRVVELEALLGENRRLVADEPAKFEKYPVEVQHFRGNTDYFRRIYRIHLK